MKPINEYIYLIQFYDYAHVKKIRDKKMQENDLAVFYSSNFLKYKGKNRQPNLKFADDKKLLLCHDYKILAWLSPSLIVTGN